ncbi:MAG: hypothetical protein CVT98_06410 [Bacteroidetes bacterium HGW-Bacteroidetes-15]|nr:MAG: hypothetical protein CVT98_06410 [Bacteroidetes bacterium HGW-Bacteroidetes-15]
MNKYLIIGRPTAWFIAILNLGVAVFQFLNLVIGWEYDLSLYQNAYYTSLIVGIVIFANDILHNNVYQKWFWLLSVVILAPITPVFYLFQRNKLIRLGGKFNSQDSI